MTLEEQEVFLKSKGWGWYVDALAFHRDNVTALDSSDERFVDGVIVAKKDYYENAIAALAEKLSK